MEPCAVMLSLIEVVKRALIQAAGCLQPVFALALVLWLPASASQIDSAPRFDCCPHSKKSDVSALSCSRNVQARCPSSLRLIGATSSERIFVTVQNEAGRLGRGRNGFCIKFANAKADKAINMADVELDVTLRIGRVESVRAIAQVTPGDTGVYCGHVILPVAGAWKLTFRYIGSGIKGKISLFTAVT
jgi:hypothetical protein